MTLEITQSGAIVLRDVSDAAWDYISAERDRLYCPAYDYWLFSRERYEGTVYVTADPTEDKTELVRIIDKLITDFGLKVQQAAMHLLKAWRRDVAYTEQTRKSNAREAAQREEIVRLKRLITNGCSHCKHFSIEVMGDDADGYCLAGKTPKLLDVSPLSFDHGEYDAQKTYHSGRKYYPCNGCKYLNQGGRA